MYVFQVRCAVSACYAARCEETRGILAMSQEYKAELKVHFNIHCSCLSSIHISVCSPWAYSQLSAKITDYGLEIIDKEDCYLENTDKEDCYLEIIDIDDCYLEIIDKQDCYLEIIDKEIVT